MVSCSLALRLCAELAIWTCSSLCQRHDERLCVLVVPRVISLSSCTPLAGGYDRPRDDFGGKAAMLGVVQSDATRWNATRNHVSNVTISDLM